MSYLRRIQRGIDYIEQHLDEDISLAEVAKVAAISQWHFQRIFKALTKETLKTYIRSRRMSNTLDKLIRTDARVIDIALDAGYDTQESFTRAFKHMFGITPNEYRKLGDNSLFLRKLELDADYLTHINQNVSLEPEILTLNATQFVGMRTSYFGPDSEKNNMGDKLPTLWKSFLNRAQEIEHMVRGTGYGIVRQTKERSDLLEYFSAFEVTDIGEPPSGMEHISLPQTVYAKFTHKGKPEDLDHTVNYVYSNWLLQSGRRHSYAADLEIYGHGYKPGSDESVICYAIPLCDGTMA